METFLNLAWALLAVMCVCHWIRFERRTGLQKRLSMVSLGLLLVILFPVISVSDDLWSIQNPAETDTCQRRDHGLVLTHPVLPVLASLPAPLLSLLIQRTLYVTAPSLAPAWAPSVPALDGIQNRPPPLA